MSWLIWAILVVIFGIFEAITVGLVSIWFAVGALVSLFVSFATDSVTIQLLVFIVVSIICLIVTRPIYLKYVKVKRVNTNSDALIGKKGIVKQKIDPLNSMGRVSVEGASWKASSVDGCCIEEGSNVKISAIKGVTLICEKI